MRQIKKYKKCLEHIFSKNYININIILNFTLFSIKTPILLGKK